MPRYIFKFLPIAIDIFANNRSDAIQEFLKMFTEENPLEHFSIEEKDTLLEKMDQAGIGSASYSGDKGN